MAIPERLRASLADRYALERELGQGGMATVYLAEDLKHKRRVAVKVLKPELAAVLGAERFVQEITTTASLSHPHILPLFDSGEAEGFLFYVMPFVDGETLRTKLDRDTQLGVDEAVRIAGEVADALQYAHEHGVIHRDIKPENILLQNGRPMVADFGIALAVSAAAGGRMTETGLSLGTPHYMSPEQATAEKEITARSDIYSIGSVLYEMLTGNPPHVGSSAQQIIMKIITERPQDVTAFRHTVPANVAAAVAKALEKLPADRFASASEFARALTDVGFRDATTATAASTAQGGGAGVSRSRIGLAIGAVAIGAAAFVLGRGSAAVPTIVDVGLPDTAQLAFMDDTPWGTENPSLAVSPDGDFFVYVARRGPQTELWYRSLVDDVARPLPRTLGGSQPALSPDGRTVAFVVGRVLRKVAVDGSTPSADVTEIVSPTGLVWTGPDEVLAGVDFGARTEWVRMSDGVRSRSGGPCGWPAIVPGRREVLCGSAGGLVLGARVVRLNDDGSVPLDANAGRLLGDSTRPMNAAQTLIDNQLVFLDRSGNLMAAPYNRETGEIGARTVAQRGLRRSVFADVGHYGVTRDGDLVYVPGSNGAIGHFVAVQPGGATRVLPIPAKEHLNFAISPDGKRLAVSSRGVADFELWLYDLATGQGDRIMTGGFILYLTWAPDGTLAVAFSEAAAQRPRVRLIPPDGGSPRDLSDLPLLPSGFVGRRFLVGGINLDVAVAEIDGARVIRVDTLKLPNAQYYPVASPDNRWLAYSGAENGLAQLFVTPFPSMDRQYKVSVDAASEPVWLPDGSLVHRIGSCWYRLRPRPGTTPPLGPPALAFCDEKLLNTTGLSNVAMPDGSILYLRTVGPTTAGYVRIVRGWRKTLGR